MDQFVENKETLPSSFEFVIKANLPLLPLKMNSLGALLFAKFDHRAENCNIFYSHLDSNFISLSLRQVRNLIFELLSTIDAKGLRRGDTVALVRMDGCSELYIALLFLAFAVKGIRVLLPMFLDLDAFPKWIDQWNCKAIIIPNTEIQSLQGHFIERNQLKSLNEIARENKLPSWDTEVDFNMRNRLLHIVSNEGVDRIVNETILSTLGQADDEILIITTSGSTGVPDQVTYKQIAYLQSCQSWQSAGLFKKELLGGRGFTPLFTHTMGIRQLFNALWTGEAVCLINTAWFLEKPETVAFLLEKMQPNHITGGPSVYRLLLELIRNFPGLKQSLSASFKQFISSGAPFDYQTRDLLYTAFNVYMNNAFGTTETQQVLTTLMDPDFQKEKRSKEIPMGLPLPGVEIGLEKLDQFNDYYRFYVNAPFMHHRILRGSKSCVANHCSDFYYTGDIVSYKGGQLYYIGREEQDFLNNGFGIKVPLPLVRKNYKSVLHNTHHSVFISFEEDPGLGLLLFVDVPHLPEGIIKDRQVLTNYSNQISTTNHQLENLLDPLEYQYFTVRQLALVNGAPPVTKKGNVSSFQLEEHYRNLFKLLKHYGIQHPNLVQLDKHCGVDHAFMHYLSPYIGQLLKILGMDYIYHRGKKDTLFTYRSQKEIPVLDFVGGYGTNFLGHNHEDIKEVVRNFMNNDEVAISDQLSIQQYAGLLGEALNSEVSKLTGKSYRIQLASTGSEAIELAIHHAYYELKQRLKKIRYAQFQNSRGLEQTLFYSTWEENLQKLRDCKPVVIGLKHSFHGNTSAARSVLYDRKCRERFHSLLPIHTSFVDDEASDWKDQVDKIIRESGIYINKLIRNGNSWKVEKQFFSIVVAAIAEPVQGEGGIRTVNPEVLTYLSQFDFPLIQDEIQSGMGRTGSFVTLPENSADYYIFGKALGGNVAKISAVLIAEDRYQQNFQPNFVSTFANSGLAAKISLRSLEIISKEHLAERAMKTGAFLKEQLRQLQDRYPGIISGIGGKGLMAGIEFKHFGNGLQLFLRILCQSDRAGYLYSAYLLKKHNIRILPSISAPNTLRVEPSAYVTKEEIQKLIHGLDDLCRVLDRGYFYQLLKPLMDEDPFDDNKGCPAKDGPMFSGNEQPAPGAIQVAFIAHFVYVTEELRALETDLAKASDTGLHILFNKLQQLLEWKPIEIFSKNLFNNQIHFTFYSLPVDAATMERLYLDGKRQKIVEKIQETTELAAKKGAGIISLGGFTSILTNNALSVVPPDGAQIISGNTLTVASGIKHILQRMEETNDLPSKATMVVIGATGNIGSAVVEYFVKNPLKLGKIILLGRREKKLQRIHNSIMKGNPQSDNPILETSVNFKDCKQADVIVIATNSNVPLLFPHHIDAARKVIISDVSVPSAVSKTVSEMPNVDILPFAAWVNLSQDDHLKMSSHTPPGTTFCCAAEAILCGLTPNQLQLKGSIKYDEVVEVMKMAKDQGFYKKMGAVKTFKAK